MSSISRNLSLVHLEAVGWTEKFQAVCSENKLRIQLTIVTALLSLSLSLSFFFLSSSEQKSFEQTKKVERGRWRRDGSKVLYGPEVTCCLSARIFPDRLQACSGVKRSALGHKARKNCQVGAQPADAIRRSSHARRLHKIGCSFSRGKGKTTARGGALHFAMIESCRRCVLFRLPFYFYSSAPTSPLPSSLPVLFSISAKLLAA